MVEDKIHIVMAADETYRKGLEVAKASLSESCAHPERLVFHLFDGDAAFADRVRREFGTYKGSTMAFLRLYLGELLPDVDWVVYSDVDTIWRRDVAELWELRDENATIQWVRDLKGTVVEFKSWCAARGVPLDGFDPGRYCCYWQRIARGTPFKRPLALPFYLREWMIRLCFPFAGAVLCDRIRRHFAWRWFVRRHFAETDHDERIPWKTSAV